MPNLIILLFCTLLATKICGGNYKISVHFIVEKPAYIAISRIGQRREGKDFTAEKYITSMVDDINVSLKDTGVVVVPDFSDINNVLRDKWSYACREPSPIIARTMIAARHFQGKEEGVMNVVYVFFCPDMYLGDFQTISYNNLGECGSFVGIMHSSIDKVFRKRVEEAVIGILLQGLYHLGKKDFNTEKYLCRYARTCFTREEDVKIKE